MARSALSLALGLAAFASQALAGGHTGGSSSSKGPTLTNFGKCGGYYGNWWSTPKAKDSYGQPSGCSECSATQKKPCGWPDFTGDATADSGAHAHTGNEMQLILYKTDGDLVLMKDKAAYDACTTTGSTLVHKARFNDKLTYTFNKAGTYYFSTTLEGGCAKGQKMAVEVTGADKGANTHKFVVQEAPVTSDGANWTAFGKYQYHVKGEKNGMHLPCLAKDGEYCLDAKVSRGACYWGGEDIHVGHSRYCDVSEVECCGYVGCGTANAVEDPDGPEKCEGGTWKKKTSRYDPSVCIGGTHTGKGKAQANRGYFPDPDGAGPMKPKSHGYYWYPGGGISSGCCRCAGGCDHSKETRNVTKSGQCKYADVTTKDCNRSPPATQKSDPALDKKQYGQLSMTCAIPKGATPVIRSVANGMMLDPTAKSAAPGAGLVAAAPVLLSLLLAAVF